MPGPFRRQAGSGGDRAGARKSGLGRREVDAAVRKLKAGYRSYAEVYGDRIFNLRAFEDRYREALVRRADLVAFVRAEIEVFEELKKKVEPRAGAGTGGSGTGNPNSREGSYSEIADRIIEHNLQKIRKYRHIDFHPEAEQETAYLLGAVTDFYYEAWSEIRRLLKPLNQGNINESLNRLEDGFCYMVAPVRGSHPRAVEDYLMALRRRSIRESERASYNFLKNGGILLNNCLQLVNHGLNYMATDPTQFSKMSQLELYKQRLQRIVEDFRLGEIRGY